MVIKPEGRGYGKAGRGRSHSPLIFCASQTSKQLSRLLGTSSFRSFLKWQCNVFEILTNVISLWRFFLAIQTVWLCGQHVCSTHRCAHAHSCSGCALQKSTLRSAVCTRLPGIVQYNSPREGWDSRGERSCFQSFASKSLGLTTKGS